jgi:hypothetical protein
MQHLQNLKTTLLDPTIQSQDALFRFTERLSSGLPGLQGNTLLLLKTSIPTSSAGIILPDALREKMRIQFDFDADPSKRFVRHVHPDVGLENTDDRLHSGAGGPVYRLWLSRLPIPHKHKAFERLGL